ncbi:hypothetical protein BGZ46_009595 [Entomortierella lignicola]|nr:hypothetical protein BGZ46_009595 [Entomortierella lignicola]
MATLSNSSNTSQAAEALLNRARRLSYNAYERTRSPLSCTEGESCRSISHIHHQTSSNIALWNSSRRTSSSSTNPYLSLAKNDHPSQSTSTELESSLTTGVSTIIMTPSISASISNKGEATIQNPTVLNRAASPINTFLTSRAHTLPCTTTGSTHLAEGLSSRPRALTLESIREVRDQQTNASDLSESTTSKNSHRKYPTENGGSLVYGVLAALRQNTDLESPVFLKTSFQSAKSSISPAIVPDKSHAIDPITTSADSDLGANISLSVSSPPSPSSLVPVTDLVLETNGDNGTISAEVSGAKEVCQIEKDLSSINEPHTSNLSTPSINSTGSVDHEKKDGKEGKGTSLLQKMGMRRNGVTETPKDNSDDGIINSHTSNSSARPSLSKGSRRSSRFLGKFVHKILPNSMSHTSSTTAPPPAQTTSQSPLSARSSRSASTSSHGPAHENEAIASVESAATIALSGSVSASSKDSQESLLLESSQYSEEISFAVNPEKLSLASAGIKDDIVTNKCTFEVEYENEEEEVKDESTESGEPAVSPYVIDDDCDDDFFLNSVLRKKSLPDLYLAPERPPVMSSSYPSNTTLDSMHTSPSLSAWSSASSYASTPSPTSPLFPSNQTYPFPNSDTKTPSKHMHYRSNPLPAPFNSGLDEKRTRLRDAVCEWRRSSVSYSS